MLPEPDKEEWKGGKEEEKTFFSYSEPLFTHEKWAQRKKIFFLAKKNNYHSFCAEDSLLLFWFKLKALLLFQAKKWFHFEFILFGKTTKSMKKSHAYVFCFISS